MKRNQTESNGMIFRNQSEPIGIITRNDRKRPEKRPKTTAGSPFGSATSRNGFLGNSPIFPAFSSKIPRFSLIFPNFLRFSPIFSEFFPNFAVFLHYNIY